MTYIKTSYSPHAFDSNYKNNDDEFKRDMSEGRQAVGKAADLFFWD